MPTTKIVFCRHKDEAHANIVTDQPLDILDQAAMFRLAKGASKNVFGDVEIDWLEDPTQPNTQKINIWLSTNDVDGEIFEAFILSLLPESRREGVEKKWISGPPMDPSDRKDHPHVIIIQII